MVSSAGQGDAVHAAHGKQPKHRLLDILKESYQDIQDLCDANPQNPKIIVIDDKNDYHLDGGDDDEKSVISPTYCEYKLYKATFTELLWEPYTIKNVENKQDFLLLAHSTKRSVGQISIQHITESGMKIQSIS